MYPYWHHAYRCGRGTSRFFWFVVGAGTATWWHSHRELHAWHHAHHCSRHRIPQDAYPAPGALPPPNSASATAAAGTPEGSPPEACHRWGWGHWGRGQSQSQEDGARDKWGWNTGAGTGTGSGVGTNAKPEGAWGPPMPMPGERAPERDVVQQATDTITELSEATLNNLLTTVESLKAKLAEHRAQREQQERELRALREAKFRQFEEWQRQQEQLLKNEKKDEPPRRLV